MYAQRHQRPELVRVTMMSHMLRKIVILSMVAGLAVSSAHAKTFTWGDATMPDPKDWDGDGIINSTDPDNDNDGVPDSTDSADYDPNVTTVSVTPDNSSKVDFARLGMPSFCYNNSSDWDDDTWADIGTEFGGGTATFRATGQTVSYSSGSGLPNCPDCSGLTDITLKIDLSKEEFWFETDTVFSRTNYDNFSFSATSTKIPLNYQEFSGGSLYKNTSFQQWLESSRDYNIPRTQVRTDNASDTIAAVMDIDFDYEACLSDPNDLKNSTLAVRGRVMIQYDIAGEYGFTHLWSNSRFLAPIN